MSKLSRITKECPKVHELYMVLLVKQLIKLHFTAVWTPNTASCWGIPCGRYGCPPAHRYSAADAAPERRQSDLSINRDVTWCSTRAASIKPVNQLWSHVMPYICDNWTENRQKFPCSCSAEVNRAATSHVPDCLFSFGMMQRTKCGWVVSKFFISLFSDSLKVHTPHLIIISTNVKWHENSTLWR